MGIRQPVIARECVQYTHLTFVLVLMLDQHMSPHRDRVMVSLSSSLAYDDRTLLPFDASHKYRWILIVTNALSFQEYGQSWPLTRRII